jgi:hypothetical protein
MAQTRADYGTKGILSFINPDFGLNGVNNLWSTCPYLEWLHDPTIGIHTFDHFTDFVTTMRGLTVGGDATGSAAVAAGSLLRITSHTHDEDEYGVLGTTAGTTMASGKDIWFEAMVRATQAAATSANLCVGLTDHAVADLMQDAGAGMAASHSSIVFNKVDTGTTWVAEDSITVTPTEITAGTFTTGISSPGTSTALPSDRQLRHSRPLRWPQCSTPRPGLRLLRFWTSIGIACSSSPRAEGG